MSDGNFLTPAPSWTSDPEYQVLISNAIRSLESRGIETPPRNRPPAEMCTLQRRYLRQIVVSQLTDNFGESFDTDMEKILTYERCGIVEVDASTLPASRTFADGSRIAIWQGDVVSLKIGAIVNAGNSALLGCFQPQHVCVDNVIHSHAGPRLRAACKELMQGSHLPVGGVEVTPGFCLPCEHVLHTVGPQAEYEGHEQPEALSRCYENSLTVCAENGIRSVSFCCISTGLFGYPQEKAAQVAYATVSKWLADPCNANKLHLVVFNTFAPADYEIYCGLASDS